MEENFKMIGCGTCYHCRYIGRKEEGYCMAQEKLVEKDGGPCNKFIHFVSTAGGENKKLIVQMLCSLLKRTRLGSNIKDLWLSEKQDILEIEFNSGRIQKVNVEADSGIAMIKDVLKAIS